MHHSFWVILACLIVSFIWLVSTFFQVFSAKGSQRELHPDYVVFTLGTASLLFLISLFFFLVHLYDIKASILHILKNNKNPVIPVICLLIMLLIIGWLLFSAILFFEKSGQFPEISINGFGGITASFFVLCSLPYIAFVYYVAYKMHLITQKYCPIRNASIFVSFGLTLGLPIFILWLFMIIDKDAWNVENKQLTITMTISSWIFILLIVLAILMGCCNTLPSEAKFKQIVEKKQKFELKRASIIFISVFNIFINSAAPLLSILSLFSFIVRLRQPTSNVFNDSRDYASQVIVIIALSFITGLIIPQMYNAYIFRRLLPIIEPLTLLRWMTLMPILEHVLSLGYIVVYCEIAKPNNTKEFIIETRTLFDIVIASPFVLTLILLSKFLFFVSYNGCKKSSTLMTMSILTIVLMVMYMIGFILSLVFLLMSQHGFNILNENDTKNLAIGFMTFIYLMAYNLLFNMPRIVLTLWPTMKKFFKERALMKKNQKLLQNDDDDDDQEDQSEEENEEQEQHVVKKKKEVKKKWKQNNHANNGVDVIQEHNYHALNENKEQNRIEVPPFFLEQEIPKENQNKRYNNIYKESDSYDQKMMKQGSPRRKSNNQFADQKEKFFEQKGIDEAKDLQEPLLKEVKDDQIINQV